MIETMPSRGEAAAEPVPTGSGAGPEGGRRTRRPRRVAWPTPDRTVRAACRCRSPFGEPEERAREDVLDVRELPLTGQIGRTLAWMEELPAGRRLRHVNTLVPWPLFAMLETRGYRYRLVGRRAGDVHVLIWRLEPQGKAAPGEAAPR